MMILGLVKWMQPVHGYDVRRELLSWHADKWANVAPGSIYHALRKLTEEGLLEEVATEQVGARPARTTYRLTPLGDEEFERLRSRYFPPPQVGRVAGVPGAWSPTERTRSVAIPLALERCGSADPVAVEGELWGEAINGAGLEAVTRHIPFTYAAE